MRLTIEFEDQKIVMETNSVTTTDVCEDIYHALIGSGFSQASVMLGFDAVLGGHGYYDDEIDDGEDDGELIKQGVN